MKKLVRFSHLGLKACGWLAAGVLAVTVVSAQSPAPRIQADVSSSEMSTVASSRPFAHPELESGRMPADAALTDVTIVFNRSAAQQADLNALLAAQLNPSSPLFHAWLTPDQFAARFGMSQADLDKVQTWLEQQGFKVQSVARSRTMIHFSGTAGQVERAFQTEMHYYNTESGVRHFAPSTALSIPAAIAPVVESIRDLDNFKPHPMHMARPRSAYTFWGTTSNGQNEQFVLFAPGDIKVAYDMNTLLGAGTTGAGQTIAIAGQSEIAISEIEAFEAASGLTTKDPTITIVPNTGSEAFSSGDEGEGELDVEWSGAMAPGANINFVFTGSADNGGGAFDALAYAVDEKIGNVISISFGECEPQLGSPTLDTTLQQAMAQGQTVIAASGDEGSMACSDPQDTTVPTAMQQEVAVSYPASSEYITGVGGTEITAANDAVGTYWASDGTSANNNILLTSATQYIPEVAWNDDTTSGTVSPQDDGGLSASGGGVSTFYTSKPSWQTGVPGIPSDSKRDVPDMALYASPEFPGYLYCTDDQSDWVQGQTGSCVSGQFYDANGNFTLAGGTSFGAPILAGMVAILNQEKGYSTGQGFLNPNLYTLASNSATYASAFHDVTTGNNDCTAGTTYSYCPSNGASLGYSAGTGYDLVTGLGSIDLGNLATAWPASTSTTIGTNTAVSAVTTTPQVGATDAITITVTSTTGTTVPTGTVTLSIDGGSSQSLTLATNGTATYSATFSTAGSHTVLAQYGGDSTHASSTGTLTITAAAVSSGQGTFTVAASNVTVSQGSSGASTITITPSGGYTGTVLLSLTTTSNSLSNLCGGFATQNSNGDGSVAVGSSAAVTTQLTFDTNASDCATGAVKKGNLKQPRLGLTKTSRNTPPNPTPLGVAFAGLLLAGFLGRHSRKFRDLAVFIGLLALGFGLSACGSSSVSTTVPDPPKGTYTFTLTGVDSATSSITAQTTFTLTID